MDGDGIVPDVVDEAPSAKVTVTYPGGIEVDFGKELTPTQVKDQPEVKWDADPNKYYVLSMVDPDAPSRKHPRFREINHWLIVNIKGSDISTGDVIAVYGGSGPPKGTGFHRYIFLVFEQKEKLTFNEPRSGKNSLRHRTSFSIRKFSEKYNLGKPIAGNYFNAQWDTSVGTIMPGLFKFIFDSGGVLLSSEYNVERVSMDFLKYAKQRPQRSTNLVNLSVQLRYCK